MPVNYNVNVENSRLQVVANAIDAGPSNGFLRLLDGSNNVLSSFQLARPCGVVANDFLSFSGLSLTDPAAARSGFAISARCEDSTGTVVISGLNVNVPPSDILMTPTNLIAAGQTIVLTVATIQGN